MKTYAVIFTLASVLAPGATAGAQTADVIGKWDVSFATGQETIPASLTLTRKADKLVGGITDGRAPERGEAPVEATLVDKKITISFDYADADGPMHIVMDGSVEKDTMGGTVQYGTRGQGDWTAKRAAAAKAEDKTAGAAAAAKVDVSGTWNASVTTSEFSATPTLALKQDGEKITGQYVSAQYGSFPLQGTLKGNALSLTFAMGIEGNSVGVTIAGTVEKDAINGSINYGDFAQGTFAAKRK